MAVSSATAYLREKLKKSGRTATDIARGLGVSEHTLRAWVRRAKFPTAILTIFAPFIDASTEELLQQGVRIVGTRLEQHVAKLPDKNIAPTIKAIGDANPESLTLAQLFKLIEICGRLQGELTPELVRQLLERMI